MSRVCSDRPFRNLIDGGDIMKELSTLRRLQEHMDKNGKSFYEEILNRPKPNKKRTEFAKECLKLAEERYGASNE